LQRTWTSTVYACFKTEVTAHETPSGRRYHRFTCAAKDCGGSINRYLDTGNAKSTSNLRRHVQSCKGWGHGEEVLMRLDNMQNAQEACEKLVAFKYTGDICELLGTGNGKPTYSARSHTRYEIR
ncbi:hypothetical protein BXZ70DRAFT_874179, partial [Cristinia sonorae]